MGLAEGLLRKEDLDVDQGLERRFSQDQLYEQFYTFQKYAEREFVADQTREGHHECRYLLLRAFQLVQKLRSH